MNFKSVVDKFFTWQTDLSTLETLQLTESVQQAIVAATLNSPICQCFPPNLEFRLTFCKKIIRLAESEGVADLLYEVLAQLQQEQPSISYKTYFIEDYHVSLRETKEIIRNGTTGLTTWPAATALAKFLGGLEEDAVTGKILLELGAGTGLSGIFVLKQRGKSFRKYIFTDCHPSVLENLRFNIAANVRGAAATVEQLDWEEASSERRRELPNIVVGADIVYDTRLIPSLVNTIKSLLSASSVAYIVCTIRNPETDTTFQQQLSVAELSWAAAHLVDNPPVKLYTIGQKAT